MKSSKLKKTEDRECVSCGITFTHRVNLNRHNRNFHSSSYDLFECYHCNAKFKRKDGLKRHIFSIHPVEYPDNHQCLSCGKIFVTYQKLWYHNRTTHNETDVKLFECDSCDRKYKRKVHLRSHIISKHMTNQSETDLCSYSCVLCCKSFGSRKQILDHLEKDHLLQLEIENHVFKSEDDFNSWMSKAEKQCCSSYRKSYFNKSVHRIQNVYVCNRSGFYYPKPCPKRQLKIRGSKKINGFCPSQITLIVDVATGTLKVEFLKTHVGHPTDTRQLPFMRYSHEENGTILKKLAMGLPVPKIVDDIIGNDIPTLENAEKIHLLSKKDVYNIAKKWNLNVTPSKRKVPKEIVEVESWVRRNSDSVLFCKYQGENDVSYFNLDNRDFVLVTMTKEQTAILQNYASKLIILDCNHSINTARADFLLYSVLVQDSVDEGYGCCFMITNRTDQVPVSIMFTCIRQKIGVVSTKIFMSDSKSSFIDTWTLVMENEPEFHLFCPWHVIKEWERNLSKVPTFKRKKLKEQVLTLLYARDIDAFHLQLVEFMHSEDEDIQPFIMSFIRNYGENYRSWAYCYRSHANLKTNVIIERFHSFFKYIHNTGLTIQQVQNTLHMLDTYLKTKPLDYLKTEIYGGKLNPVVMASRVHHDEAKSHISDSMSGQKEIETVSSDLWIVPSFTSDDETYLVERANETCESNCHMICSECHFCSHQFTCTCPENAIKNIMCKHIHSVCLTKMLNVIELGKSENCIIIDDEKCIVEEVIPISVEHVDPSNDIVHNDFKDDDEEEHDAIELINEFANLVKTADEKKRQYLKNTLGRLKSDLSSI